MKMNRNIEIFVSREFEAMRTGAPFDVALLRKAAAAFPLGNSGKVFIMSLESPGFGLAPPFVRLAEADIRACLRAYLEKTIRP